ncbi:MAG: hypothetical protein IJR80_01430 [Treponema sp.]|nr:hypothetical protein [Treponema sp.]
MTKYVVGTEFNILDNATKTLGKISGAGSRMERALSGQLKAAETRFVAFGKTAQKAVLGAFGAMSTAAATAIKQAIPLGMELEQNIGGTEAVFGDYAKNVQSIAEKSYKNMGLSASDYMATANKMGSLFQGSGLSQERALDLTSRAMQRAADVASVMGIDTTSAMESIAGAAKGNFTMMDNLGVAMNATTLQAYALEKGLNFKWNVATNAQKAELAMQMFFERTAQYEGNFAREAEQTLSGSFGQMKTSVQNVLANLALGKSLEGPLANMQDSILTFTRNIVPTVVNIINQLPDIVAAVLEEISPIIEEAMGRIRSPFGEILVFGLKVIKFLWDARVAIIAIAAAALSWRLAMDAVLIVTKAIKAFNVVVSVGKGFMLAYQAAMYGTQIAIHSTGAAAVAASLGIKLYGVAAKVATAAQWLLNAAMSANSIALVIIGITALIRIILVLTNKWKAVTAAVDGFFAKIHEMKGVGGVILTWLVTPLEVVWKMVRSVFDIFAAFKAGGFINGIKMIGLSILQFICAPLQGILNMLSFIPGIGGLSDKMNSWFENTRANLLNGSSTDEAGGLPAESAQEAEIATAAPTQTAAQANSYSREETVTTNQLQIGLEKGLTVTSGTVPAPAFTLNTGRR